MKYLLLLWSILLIKNSVARKCFSHEFECGTRNSTATIIERDQCIPLDQVCDGVPDCPFSDDEWNCPSFDLCSKSDNTFTCKSGNICILKAWTCDGLWDCPDQSDEADELCHQALNCNDGFVCTNTNNRCVPSQNICNNKTYDGCLDGQDESICSTNSIASSYSDSSSSSTSIPSTSTTDNNNKNTPVVIPNIGNDSTIDQKTISSPSSTSASVSTTTTTTTTIKPLRPAPSSSSLPSPS